MNNSRQDTDENVDGESGVVLAKADTRSAVQEPPTLQGGREGDTTTAAASAVDSAVGNAAADAAEVNRADRNWAVAAHLSSLTLYLGIPFGDLLGPLAIWLIKKDESPFAEAHAKESLNFQISLLIYTAVAFLLLFFLVGFLLLPALIALHVVLVVVATFKASEGKLYRYPLTIRFIS